MSVRAMLAGRCPRCRQGRIFQPGFMGLIGMLNDRCPVCGLAFLREAGYFLGAMYVSYGLGVLTILPAGMVMAIVLEWPLAVVLPLVILLAVVLMPLFLRFSRSIWLHLDQNFDPR